MYSAELVSHFPLKSNIAQISAWSRNNMVIRRHHRKLSPLPQRSASEADDAKVRLAPLRDPTQSCGTSVMAGCIRIVGVVVLVNSVGSADLVVVVIEKRFLA
jgi:hypothetical protein